jgi:cysteinyl-tRNA synthetase
VIAIAKLPLALPGSQPIAYTPEGGENHPSPPQIRAYVDRLDAAMSDDLNTPLALPLLEEMLGDKRIGAEAKRDLLATVEALLGLPLLSLERAELRLRPAGMTLTPEEIEARLDERQQARAAKDFARSDTIRDALIGEGVEVMDGDPLRWEWKVALD